MNGTVHRTEELPLLDEARLVSWNFKRAWPTKCTGPSLNAEQRDAIESLEIAHEGLSIDGQAG
jgi:phage tail-like protein